jgi:hypothetical protein
MKNTTAKRVGPVMAAITAYVAGHPGCPKLHPALACGPNGSTRYGYEAVNRAMAAGLIENRGGAAAAYRLYPTGSGELLLAG